MKQLQRLLFLQGNKCFFCGHGIPEGEASIEHLHAVSNGGEKSDENAVVCCKAVNNWLGNRSVKEKLEVVLSHRRQSACLATILPKPQVKPGDKIATQAQELLPDVVKNLTRLGDKRPKKLTRLKNSLKTTFKKASPKVIEAVMVLLKKKGYTTETDGKVSYPRL